MTLEEMIEVMTAYKNGEKIQVASEGSGCWTDDDCPKWDWDSFNYRIKPNPTPELFKRSMQRIFVDGKLNVEEKHIKADKLMCNILCELGYAEGVKIFRGQEKWYS